MQNLGARQLLAEKKGKSPSLTGLVRTKGMAYLLNRPVLPALHRVRKQENAVLLMSYRGLGTQASRAKPRFLW